MKATSMTILTLVLLVACTGPKIKASKDLEIKRITLTDIKELTVGNTFEVAVYPASGESYALIEVNENLMPHTEFEQRRNTLKIGLKGNLQIRGKQVLKAKVYCSELEAIDISGASRLVFADVFHPSGGSIEVSGASRLEGEVNATKLNIDQSGASRIELIGNVDQMFVECSGASKFKARKLQAKVLSIDLSGASSAQVFASQSINAEASGSSKISYWGQPTQVAKESSFASKIVKKE